MVMGVFTEGQFARKNGFNLINNPYDRDNETENHCLWIRGFLWGVT